MMKIRFDPGKEAEGDNFNEVKQKAYRNKYLAESDVSLDFTEFFKTGRVLFAEEETPDARYGPSSVTYEIMRGDINLANNYGVEYFLIPNDKYVPNIQDGVVLDLVYISLLESNSYKQFEDEKVKVYSIYV